MNTTLEIDLFESTLSAIVTYELEAADEYTRHPGTLGVVVERVQLDNPGGWVLPVDITRLLNDEQFAAIRREIRKELKLNQKRAWYEYGYCEECE
jgi:hypothetical protein